MYCQYQAFTYKNTKTEHSCAAGNADSRAHLTTGNSDSETDDFTQRFI